MAPISTLARRLDPSWLFIAAGSAALVSAVLIPAADDVAEARWRRDQALAAEEYQIERLERHSAYLDALRRAEPRLVRSLALEHLRLVPAGQAPLPRWDGRQWDGRLARRMNEGSRPAAAPDASVFPRLEPERPVVPEPRRPDSTLRRLATGRSRLWMLGAGAVCVLVGLLSPARARQARDTLRAE